MSGDPYEEEVDEVWIKCIMCQDTMLKEEWDLHDCPIIPWEYVGE